MVTVTIMDHEPFNRIWVPKSVTVTIPLGTYAKAELYALAEAVSDFTDRLFTVAAGDVELFRLITPFKTIEHPNIDVTKFLNLFKGTVTFKVWLGTIAQWNVTIRLTLTEGTPPTMPNFVPLLLWHDFYPTDHFSAIPVRITDGRGFIFAANAYMGANEKLHIIYADGVQVASMRSKDRNSVPIGQLIPPDELSVTFGCEREILVDLPELYTWDSGRITTSLVAIVGAPLPQHSLKVNSSPILGIPVNVDATLVGETPTTIIVEEKEHVISVPETVEV